MIQNYFDISLPVYPGMVVWEDDSPVEIGFECTIAGGDTTNLSYIRMGVHTGTHVDAPFHFIEGRICCGRRWRICSCPGHRPDTRTGS